MNFRKWVARWWTKRTKKMKSFQSLRGKLEFNSESRRRARVQKTCARRTDEILCASEANWFWFSIIFHWWDVVWFRKCEALSEMCANWESSTQSAPLLPFWPSAVHRTQEHKCSIRRYLNRINPNNSLYSLLNDRTPSTGTVRVVALQIHLWSFVCAPAAVATPLDTRALIAHCSSELYSRSRIVAFEPQ